LIFGAGDAGAGAGAAGRGVGAGAAGGGVGARAGGSTTAIRAAVFRTVFEVVVLGIAGGCGSVDDATLAARGGSGEGCALCLSSAASFGSRAFGVCCSCSHSATSIASISTTETIGSSGTSGADGLVMAWSPA
jgi:hypothetical protein